MRLNKYIAHAGVCSRREAAQLVKDGHIQVNGTVIIEPGVVVEEGDEVTYKGRVLKPRVNMVYFIMNKPKGVITTVKDEKGRKTVMDLMVNKTKERIFPVGRLDRATTGLLLLTNDGDLAKKLTHPSHKVKKIYHAVLDKSISEADLDKIAAGLVLEDGLAEVDKVGYVQGAASKKEIGLEIHIGKNRIVRRIFEHLGYTVVKLDRVYFGGLTKKDLPRGFSRPLTDKEVIMLKHFT